MTKNWNWRKTSPKTRSGNEGDTAQKSKTFHEDGEVDWDGIRERVET